MYYVELKELVDYEISQLKNNQLFKNQLIT